jgi:alpha-L-arabinofuranosidase
VSSEARIAVNPTVRVATLGDIVGAVVNEHYWSPRDPIHPDWYDDYLGRTIDAVRELAPVNGKRFALRFGHTITDGSWGNDGYHWAAALDPRAWATSIDEFMEYAGLVGGEPYVAVNFGSGTASEAGSYVAYVNGTDPNNPYVQMRIEQGRAEPYNVRNWIVGFEQYAQWETGFHDSRPFDYANPEAKNGGDPDWVGKPASNPENFTARVAQYVREMRDASPTPIEIYAPLNNWDLGYWGGPEASVRTIAASLGPVVDGFALHYYPANTGYGETDVDLLGRPATLADKLDKLQMLWSQYGPAGKRLKIGDVEFNNNSRSDEQTHELVNGLFLADTLRVLASKGVSSAFYFAVSAAGGNGSGFSYFEQGDVSRLMPTYLATQLMARHLGTEVVEAEVFRSKSVTATGGKAGSFSYPTLTALASLSADRSTLYLVVINKHLTQDQTAEVDLSGTRVRGEATVTLLNGPAPDSVAGEIELTESRRSIGNPIFGGGFTQVFPAHSITAIEIPLAVPVQSAPR